MAKIQAKVSSGIRLGQGEQLSFCLKDICHAQVDGEPFFLGPSNFTIDHFNQANMLFNCYGDPVKTKFNRLCGRVDEEELYL